MNIIVTIEKLGILYKLMYFCRAPVSLSPGNVCVIHSTWAYLAALGHLPICKP